MHNLSDWVGEAESRVERVVGWAIEATEVLCTCLEQQREMQQKRMDFGIGKTIHIFGVVEGQREKLRSTVYCQTTQKPVAVTTRPGPENTPGSPFPRTKTQNEDPPRPISQLPRVHSQEDGIERTLEKRGKSSFATALCTLIMTTKRR